MKRSICWSCSCETHRTRNAIPAMGWPLSDGGLIFIDLRIVKERRSWLSTPKVSEVMATAEFVANSVIEVTVRLREQATISCQLLLRLKMGLRQTIHRLCYRYLDLHVQRC